MQQRRPTGGLFCHLVNVSSLPLYPFVGFKALQDGT